ncbi:glycosyl hydrolase [Paenibacillus sp.]|uniref:glycosyl hydrolase n=1 Tax=Paenibacillus sp. TaxID=58172 RepID=UPI002D37370A|nr:glycosyl hydrolase [Paenibacillus sp.]HZG84105.1 glycosyl hydrolase [Paenibacillus sp.]
MTQRDLQFLSFWAINDPLEPDSLKAQLDEMRAAGLNGVVFHPRYYPNRPEYMGEAYLAAVSELILYAKRIGMTFWLYDENGWPSGTAGGAVLARRPDLTCRWVALEADGAGGFRPVFRERRAPSSFDPEAVSLFMDITHEGYRRGLDPEAFAYVEGFFTDEVGFLDGHGATVKDGSLPWDDRLPELYAARYGEELLPRLPALFADGADSADSAEARVRYWELITDLLAESFYRPIREWCARHGKRFTAHLKAEEHPFFQLSYSGSCFRVLREVETPAIDALERYPGNHYYPRIAHSIAMQQGREHALAEAMGGSGWGVSPESFVDYCLWLASHGVDRFVLHLNQYRLKSQAIRDWPPSMPCHLTWREAFPAVLADVRRRAAALPDLRAEPELLVVAPTRGVMAAFVPSEAHGMNEHDGSHYPDNAAGRINRAFLELIDACYASGAHYELTEEREEAGALRDGALWIGRRAYRRVLVADGCRWAAPERLDALRAAGVAVFAAAEAEAALHGPRRVREAAAASAPAGLTPAQSLWRAEAPARNQLPLAFERAGERLRAVVRRAPEAALDGAALVLHDPVEAAYAQGERLSLERRADGLFEAPLPAAAGAETLTIEVEPLPGGEGEPFAFVRGRFTVASRSGFAPKDDRQLKSAGPFELRGEAPPLAEDAVTSGYPFAGEPIAAVKTFECERAVEGPARLRLNGVEAQAARVFLDGVDAGWCWGPTWSVALPNGLAAGAHELRVELIPSTFNTFGPHRHIDGDRHLTSPAQYEGVKNFADRPDAPERTHGDFWHFVRFGIAGDVTIERE